jgi:hypothetical protein
MGIIDDKYREFFYQNLGSCVDYDGLENAIKKAKNGSLALLTEPFQRQEYPNGLVMIGSRDRSSLFNVNNPIYTGRCTNEKLLNSAKKADRCLILIGDGRITLDDESFTIRAYSIEDFIDFQRTLEKELYIDSRMGPKPQKSSYYDYKPYGEF